MQPQLGLYLEYSFQLFGSDLRDKEKLFMKLQQQFINSHMVNSGLRCVREIQQGHCRRIYHCLLGANRGLGDVSQHGSFLQIGALPCRQGKGRTPWWVLWEVGCKPLQPWRETQGARRASLCPSHPVQPPDLEGPSPSWSEGQPPSWSVMPSPCWSVVTLPSQSEEPTPPGLWCHLQSG